jgi:protein-S-isoprenylcysteine O-methyltransferase Ste14
MTVPTRKPRGGGWVVAQFILLGILLVAPFLERSQPPTELAVPLGIVFTLAGLAFAALGVLQLGGNLTAFPRPIDNGTLIENGVYGIVRHPIYTGIIFCALGWSIVMWSGLAFVLAVVLFIFFDRKAAQEEVWLAEAYRGYPAYQQRVKKLLPGVY